MKVYKDYEFVKIAKDIANNYKTLYVLGCFGSPLNDKNKKRYTTNNEYNKSRASMINSASSDTFGFDCVCLLKGILWGWCGNTNATYGGATYQSNGVPDVNADKMMDYCEDVRTDFKNIKIGEFVHMKGHIGVYIGDGLAVECTPAWKNKVQITAVGNIGKVDGYPTRTWENHGKSIFIEYTDTPTPTLKHKVGDVVEINGVFTSSTSTKKLTPLKKVGTITKIVDGARNPYLLNNGDIGWTNDSCIVEPLPTDYKKLYEEELTKNKLLQDENVKLQDKIKKAIEDLT